MLTLTKHLLDIVQFSQGPTGRVCDIVFKHRSSELLQSSSVVQHQPDVVSEQGADAHREQDGDHEHEQNVIPRDSQIVKLISASRNTYLAAPRFW